MNSPAERVMRLSAGMTICLFLTLSFAVLDDRVSETSPSMGILIGLIALFCGLVALFLRVKMGSPSGSLVTDRWFSRDEEEVMRENLRKEIEEADVERMGASWARYEMEHLETKHEEE